MHINPVAQGWVVEHDCPAVLSAVCLTQTFLALSQFNPVAHCCVVVHVCPAVFAAVGAAHFPALHSPLVHCVFEVQVTPLANLAGNAVLSPMFKFESVIAFPVKANFVPEDNNPDTPAAEAAHCPVAVLHVLPVPQLLFVVHGTQVPVVDGATDDGIILQYPTVQSAFEAHETVPAEPATDGVHAALHLARHADWHSPTVVVSVPAAPPVFAAACPAHTPPVHESPVAHGRFVEHDCPAVLAAVCATHFPEVHVSPVAHGRFAEHVCPAVLGAGAAINVPDDAVLGDNFKLEIGIVTFPVRGAKTSEPPAAGFAAHLQAQFPFGQSLCVVHEEGLFCPVFVIVCIPTCALSCGAILLYIRVPILAKADAETIEATIKIAITRAISVFPFILYPPRSCLHVCD